MTQDFPQLVSPSTPGPRALERGPLQRCRHFVPGLRDRPWWDAGEFAAATALQASYQAIRAEFLNILLCGQLRLHPQSRGGPRAQISDGDWNIFEILSDGRVNAASSVLAPRTSRTLMSLPEVTTNPNGLAYFSVLDPGVHIKAHCGPTNSRIRIHLGLLAPAGAAMRVGHETRPWQEGACTVFDDSWEHEVFNSSEFLRAVLLFDVWHPDMTADQIGEIISARPPGTAGNKAKQKERAGWLDEARLHGGFAGPSLYRLVGPRQLRRMVASTAKTREARHPVLALLRTFAADSLEAPGVQRAPSDHTGVSSGLWSSLASLVARQPGLLPAADVINIIHIGSVFWRSSASNELLSWEFMEHGPAGARDKLFATPRRLATVPEVLQWCHEEGSTLAPLSMVAAAATLAIQDHAFRPRSPGPDEDPGPNPGT
jgi:aspartyl/asparaginyl beta-hydroxylase (cupin superfamily)